ncbi:MAG: IPExxxVDY family protein [Bacteroidia bacterium]
MAKKLLKIDFSFEYDFLLFAIVCSQKDYRLCFELNQRLKINLKREEDVSLIIDSHQNRSNFSNYYYRSKLSEHYRVINNKGQAGSFIPESKNIDYFLQVKNMQSRDSSGNILQHLKKIEIISGVYEIEASKLKSADNFLIFE